MLNRSHSDSGEDIFLMDISNDRYGISTFQLYLFNEGTNFRSYEMLGVHKTDMGFRFAVWAPKAKSVSVTGGFNGWAVPGLPLEKLGTSGVWCGVFDGISEGDLYKYAIETSDGEIIYKADPFAVRSELRPNTASVVYELEQRSWKDSAWMEKREKTPPYQQPMNIYEVHAGSWKQHEDGSFYTYRELAEELVPYAKDMGYTHIELMPITEYPFDGSWGYQVTGFFSATSRYGTPEDLRYLVESCHRAGIGIIMDWVPAHFPRDAHGLFRFDGTPVYEYADSRLGEHKDWGTMVFDYSKSEVISFLTSSAYFWVKEFHFDGLRVDAVSSMLYRDYSRNNGEWLPNIYGGNHNLEAIEFLRTLNKIMFREFPNLLMIAEESTAWSMVTGDVKDGALGFNYKWNMGWMNDTLRYMSMDPYFRSFNHNLLTFLLCYAYSENFILPLSHDEVVHGKKSLIDKMYGEYEQKFESYKALLGFYMSLPGKKLLFMGGDIGQFLEWRYDEGLEWQLLDMERHKRLQDYVRVLNHFYLEDKPLWELDNTWDGFAWINEGDYQNSVISYMRKGKKKKDFTVVAANFTPLAREAYPIGVPSGGDYEVVLDSSDESFGGETRASKRVYKSKKSEFNTFEHTIWVDIPGLSVIYIKKAEKKPKPERETVKKRRSGAASEQSKN